MEKQQNNLKISSEGLAASSGFKILNIEDIRNVAQGACFLASGGGGSLQLALTEIIPAFFNDQTQINLVGVDALNWEGDWGAVVAGMGSPLKLFDDPTLVKAAIPAYEVLADLCFSFKAAGKERYKSLSLMDFCLPVEIGAVNSLVPMIVADGTPPILYPFVMKTVVIDADGAGRAVPTLPLTTYARQIPIYPNVLGGDNELEPQSTYFDYASLNVQDESTLEAAFLGLIDSTAFGYASGLAIYAASALSFRACNPVPNGVSDSLVLGQIINQTSGNDRISQVLSYVNNSMQRVAKQIFYGQVTDMEQATSSLDNGYVKLAGSGNFANQNFEVLIENENIWATITRNGTTQPYIVSPDSMNYLTDTGDVLDNSDLWTAYQKGERPTLSIIAIQAAKEVRNNSALMTAWASEVASKKGPNTYITPWINS
jgi:hypothetical protein